MDVDRYIDLFNPTAQALYNNASHQLITGKQGTVKAGGEGGETGERREGERGGRETRERKRGRGTGKRVEWRD